MIAANAAAATQVAHPSDGTLTTTTVATRSHPTGNAGQFPIIHRPVPPPSVPLSDHIRTLDSSYPRGFALGHLNDSLHPLLFPSARHVTQTRPPSPLTASLRSHRPRYTRRSAHGQLDYFITVRLWSSPQSMHRRCPNWFNAEPTRNVHVPIDQLVVVHQRGMCAQKRQEAVDFSGNAEKHGRTLNLRRPSKLMKTTTCVRCRHR